MAEDNKIVMPEKVVVILGPTATGKTKLAVKLAKKFKGEIISADSRQVYKGMDVGTGKDLREYQYKVKNQKLKIKNAIKKSKVEKVPYHLIDVVSPKQQFTVADWQQRAMAAIKDIHRRNKLPIVVGGTGLYITALTEGYVLPEVRSENQELRIKLDKLSLRQILARLKKIDPKTYKIIDKKNRRRVQRALEIYYQTGRPKSAQLVKEKPAYNFLLLGLTFPREELKKRTLQRLKTRFDKENMVEEVARLHKKGLSWKKLDSFGLEYRWIARYLQNKISYEEMFDQLSRATFNFAKRQMTWFKRDQDINWIKDHKQAEQLVKKFIK